MQENNRPEIANHTSHSQTASMIREVAVVFPCYNEALNIDELYARISNTIAAFSQFRFRLYFIDNASTDGTADKLRAIAATDPRVCVILNARNFGHIRSPFHAILEAEGDCVSWKIGTPRVRCRTSRTSVLG